MSDTTLRLRAFVSSWFAVLLAALLVATAAGAVGTYATHVDPGTTTERRAVGEWTVAGGFDYGATVTRENPVFPVGTELTNRSTYFTRASPVLDGRFSVAHDAARAANVSVTLDASLVLQSADEETVYWTDRTPLESTHATDVPPGEAVTVAFALNASRAVGRVEEIRAALGSTPGEASAFVAVDVRVAGTVDGERSRLRFTERLPVALVGDTYTVANSGPVRESVRRTETITVPRAHGPLRSYGSPLLLLGGVAGLGLVGYGRRRGAFDLTAAERDRLAFADDRVEFDEWIARVRLPPEAFEKSRAEAASLGDLVDFAIDTGTAVVEAPDGDEFYVVGREYLYAYEPPHVGEATGGSTAGSNTAVASTAGAGRAEADATRAATGVRSNGGGGPAGGRDAEVEAEVDAAVEGVPDDGAPTSGGGDSGSSDGGPASNDTAPGSGEES